MMVLLITETARNFHHCATAHIIFQPTSFRWLTLRLPFTRPAVVLRLGPPSQRQPQKRCYQFDVQNQSAHVAEAGRKGDNGQSLPTIFPNSLQKTLQAHRDTNQANLIRFIPLAPSDEDGGSFEPQKRVSLRQSNGTRSIKNHQGGSERHGALLKKPTTQDSRNDEGFLPPSASSSAGAGRTGVDTTETPWLSYLAHRRFQHAFEFLTSELLAFDKYITLNAEEQRAAEKLYQITTKILESADSRIESTLSGSRSTGLALPYTGINIEFRVPDAKDQPQLEELSKSDTERKKRIAKRKLYLRSMTKKTTMATLKSIRKKLQKKGGPNAVFPKTGLVNLPDFRFVYARHAATGLTVHIHPAQLNSDAWEEISQSYLSEFPTLRPLFAVIKQMLHMRGLDQMKGSNNWEGLTSYSLLMMIVATLKLSGARFGPHDAAGHLLFFLQFYTHINFNTTGISVDPPELFVRRRSTATARVPRTVSIEIAMSRQHGIDGTDATDTSAAASCDVDDHRSDDDEYDGDVDEYNSEADEYKSDVSEPTGEIDDRISNGRKRINAVNLKRPYKLCLQDPVNPYCDLGFQARNMLKIQRTITTLYGELKDSLNAYKDAEFRMGVHDCCDTDGRPSNDHQAPHSILAPLVGGNYDDFEQKRAKLQEYAGNL